MLKPLVTAVLCLAAATGSAQTPSGAAATETRVDEDPNYSRLLFAPTGRPLKKGDGYFSDSELVFPGVAVGLTDNLSIAGGLSVIPGLRLDRQVFYVSPRVGWNLSDKAAVSAGVLYAAIPEDDGADDITIAYAVGTFGSRRRSLSVGLGLGDAYLKDGFEAHPVLMLGGSATVSRHVAIVSENWLALGSDFDVAEQPFGLGVRFFGDRLSADVGLVFIPSLVSDGMFLPWASISYHFGPSASERERR